ncbi:MAG: NAD(P)/FAD-dependent oxidoreductase [Variibacter sp.]
MAGAENLRASKRIGVIGAGAVGLCCALHLRQRGHDVDLIDYRNPGEGASLGNAGIIATSEVFPVARPGTLRQVPRMLLDPIGPLVIRPSYAPKIAPWLARFLLASRPAQVDRLSRALAGLLAPAGDAWREVAKLCHADSRLEMTGWLRLQATPAQMRRAQSDAEAQRRLGVRSEVLSVDEARELEPALSRNFAGAAYFPDAGKITSPLGMMRAIAAHLRSAGVEFWKGRAQRIEASPAEAVVVDEAGKRSVYDQVVIAAGAWSRRLVQSLGADVCLDTERGYHVMLPTPEKTVKRAVSVPVPGYSLVQMEDGLRVTTGIEFAGLDAPADFRRIRRILREVGKILPGVAPQPRSEWLGFRPSMPQSLPVIGPLENARTVFLAFGHGHLGLTLAPVTGRVAAQMIDGETPSVDMTPFLPARHVWPRS